MAEKHVVYGAGMRWRLSFEKSKAAMKMKSVWKEILNGDIVCCGWCRHEMEIEF